MGHGPQTLETRMNHDAEYWKRIAAHLAACHAATLEHLPKRTFARERDRLKSVCLSAAGYLSELEEPPPYVLTRASVDNAISRCCDAALRSRQ